MRFSAGSKLFANETGFGIRRSPFPEKDKIE